MKYLMLICVDESKRPTPEESRRHQDDTYAWATEMDGRGARLQGNALKPVRDGKTVRVRDGEVLIANSPCPDKGANRRLRHPRVRRS